MCTAILIGWDPATKTKGQTLRYRLETNQNVLVSFPNLSCWEQIVSIWSRICSPGPNRHDLFRWGRFGNENSDILVSFLLEVGLLWNVCVTFVLYCFDITTRNPPSTSLDSYTRALLVSKDSRHLFVTPWDQAKKQKENAKNAWQCKVFKYFRDMEHKYQVIFPKLLFYRYMNIYAK